MVNTDKEFIGKENGIEFYKYTYYRNGKVHRVSYTAEQCNTILYVCCTLEEAKGVEPINYKNLN